MNTACVSPLTELIVTLTSGDLTENAKTLLASGKARWLTHGFNELDVKKQQADEQLLSQIFDYAERYGRCPDLDTLRSICSTAEYNDGMMTFLADLPPVTPTFLPSQIDASFDEARRWQLSHIYRTVGQKAAERGSEAADALLAKYLARDYRETEQEAVDPNEYVFGECVSAEEGEGAVSLKAINAAKVKPEHLEWLWQDRIVKGKICLFSGKPGCGKTLALLDLIARLTTGRDWPDGSRNTHGPKKVLLGCSEDGLNDTVVPRLMAAGADLAKIEFIHYVKVNGGRKRQFCLDTDLAALRNGLKAHTDIALVALDPMTSFFGGVDINKDKEVRPMMDALSAICNQFGVSLVSVIHHNKRSDVDALQKVLGASSLVGAVRTIWGFSRDVDDKKQHYMTLVKSNLSAKETGIKYTIGEKSVDGIKAAHVVWGEETEATANELLNAERDTSGRKDNKQITLAKAYLPAALSKGPRFARDLYREAQEQGISEATLKKASYEISGVVKVQKADGWVWSMSRPETFATEDVI